MALLHPRGGSHLQFVSSIFLSFKSQADRGQRLTVYKIILYRVQNVTSKKEQGNKRGRSSEGEWKSTAVSGRTWGVKLALQIAYSTVMVILSSIVHWIQWQMEKGCVLLGLFFSLVFWFYFLLLRNGIHKWFQVISKVLSLKFLTEFVTISTDIKTN